MLFVAVLIPTESSHDQFLLFHLAFSALIDDQKVSIVGLNTVFMGKTRKISLGEDPVTFRTTVQWIQELLTLIPLVVFM